MFFRRKSRSSLRFKTHSEDEVTLIKLTGVIDENTKLKKLRRQVSTNKLVIDLAEVERINSCGVRDWITLLADMQRDNIAIVLASCSVAIVRCLNASFNFSGHAVVVSLYAPYYCSSCDLDVDRHFDRDYIGPPPFEAPIQRCERCDMVLDFDDLPEGYFGFLARQPSTYGFEWHRRVTTHIAEEVEDTLVQRNDPTKGW